MCMKSDFVLTGLKELEQCSGCKAQKPLVYALQENCETYNFCNENTLN